MLMRVRVRMMRARRKMMGATRMLHLHVPSLRSVRRALLANSALRVGALPPRVVVRS